MAIEQTVTMLMYSPRKYRPKRIAEYSVWYPAMSSVSASGRSNGKRLVSANAAVKYRMNASGWRTMNHRPDCEPTIFSRSSEPERMTTPMSANDTAIS